MCVGGRETQDEDHGGRVQKFSFRGGMLVTELVNGGPRCLMVLRYVPTSSLLSQLPGELRFNAVAISTWGLRVEKRQRWKAERNPCVPPFQQTFTKDNGTLIHVDSRPAHGKRLSVSVPLEKAFNGSPLVLSPVSLSSSSVHSHDHSSKSSIWLLRPQLVVSPGSALPNASSFTRESPNVD